MTQLIRPRKHRDPAWVLEVKCDLFQRVMAVFVSAIMAYGGVGTLVMMAYPDLKFPYSTLSSRPPWMWAGGVGLILLAIWMTGSVFRYRLSANAKGMEQRTIFVTTRVRWEDVVRYRIELVSGGSPFRMWEPVMYDDDGRTLLRPCIVPVLGGTRYEEAREEFWQYAEKHLRGKKASYVGS